jgi:hypothetical protein
MFPRRTMPPTKGSKVPPRAESHHHAMPLVPGSRGFEAQASLPCGGSPRPLPIGSQNQLQATSHLRDLPGPDVRTSEVLTARVTGMDTEQARLGEDRS